MSNVLVAYFSTGGATEDVAEKLARAANADLFEIVPVEPYTDLDLNILNNNSRSAREMDDESCRPAIASKIDNFDYDVIFVGFPIWWYREPRIIDTFLESYDFANKAVIPFSTSDISVMGKSYKYIQKLIPDAFVDKGMKFDRNTTIEQLKTFISDFI